MTSSMHMGTFRRQGGQPLTLSNELGSGGEARVYAIAGDPTIVAKIYHRPTPTHGAKLRVMLAGPPSDPTRTQGHVSIAWPTDLILDGSGNAVGFLMPNIDFATSVPMLKLYNPQDRLQKAPTFTWEYLIRTARNMASALEALHTRKYVVGDLNESNILVSNTALVTLVDCDSMQVPVGAGQVLRCPVGKPEYTPPELQGKDFSAVDRQPTHDNFGLGVLIFMLLMEGVHPFAGVWQGVGNPPTVEENIRSGSCPYTAAPNIAPPRFALPFTMLPPNLQALMRNCFGRGQSNPGARPTPAQWQQALRDAEAELTHCKLNSQHVYGRHLSRCPWCERVQKGFPDPFPQIGGQTPLPGITWSGTASSATGIGQPGATQRPAGTMVPSRTRAPKGKITPSGRAARIAPALIALVLLALVGYGALYQWGPVLPFLPWEGATFERDLQSSLCVPEGGATQCDPVRLALWNGDHQAWTAIYQELGLGPPTAVEVRDKTILFRYEHGDLATLAAVARQESAPQIRIAAVRTGDRGWVEVRNVGGGAQPMDGWQLTSATGTYTFPSGRTLRAGQSCYIHASGSGWKSCGEAGTPLVDHDTLMLVAPFFPVADRYTY